MAKNKAVRALGVGLIAGGMLVAAPAGMAFADGGLGGLLSSAVDGANDAVQNVVDQNNKGLQGITEINNEGLQSIVDQNNKGLQSGVGSLNDAVQATVPATQSTLTAANGLVKFAVHGLLRGGN